MEEENGFFKKCACYCLPMEGEFIIGNIYSWHYIVDGIVVTDENGKEIQFDEIKFLWFFKNTL